MPTSRNWDHPTAVHAEAAAHDTALSLFPAFPGRAGLGTILQTDPSHCSMGEPTAMQADAEVHETEVNTPPGAFGLDATVQVAGGDEPTNWCWDAMKTPAIINNAMTTYRAKRMSCQRRAIGPITPEGYRP